jgi:hypothetical protein
MTSNNPQASRRHEPLQATRARSRRSRVLAASVVGLLAACSFSGEKLLASAEQSIES